MHNFLPMPTSWTLHGNQEIEGARNSCSMNQLKQNMQSFWRERLTEICDAQSDVRGQHPLPLARVRKVMKSDEQVKMISADTPVVFAKASETFIMELTLRAWMHTQESKRRTLQRNDVANAIWDDDLLRFLKDFVPMETYQQEAQVANHDGVYVPLPVRGTPTMPPNYLVPMQRMNQSERATSGGRPVAADHRLAFPMNLLAQYNTNPPFFARVQEMQENCSFPPPTAPGNGDDPYLGFK